MGVGRLSLVCWTVFLVMCVAFMPLAIAIERHHVVPGPANTLLAVVVVGLVWWGPGCYGIYLAVAAIGNGDPWLLRHGLRGGALVLSVRPTLMYVQSGGLRWNAARIYKYRLRVSLLGRSPYETNCYMLGDRATEGETVGVAVARRNRRRIVIDFGPGGNDYLTPERQAVIDAFSGLPPEPEPVPTPEPLSPGTERIHRLVELDRRHREGAITDAEYATEKARILGR